MALTGCPPWRRCLQAHLQPGQAVQTLNDRMKRINKINVEIADWLQVRTR
jgi:cystathionine beta-lyase/cystathionine gamma-synthase